MKRSFDPRWNALLVVGLLFGGSFAAFSAEKNWKAGVTGEWAVAANWSEEAVPEAGDSVFVTAVGAHVLLTAETPGLAELTLGGTLVMTNWDTRLNAGEVTVLTNGLITLPAAFTNGGMSNRVHLVCDNLTVESGGWIAADGKGYASGSGLGAANGASAVGAGHGGQGGRSSTLSTNHGAVYDSIEAPVMPGSGGGGGWDGKGYSGGGPGGGVVRIEATGTVTVEGLISADGLNGTRAGAGGGAGGTVYLACTTFAGTAGVIRANGGRGYGSTGGGGGGRIAIVYQQVGGAVGVRFEASANATNTGYVAVNDRIGPQMGTLHLSSTNLLADVWKDQIRGAVLHVPGFTAFDRAVEVENAMIGLPDGFVIDAPSVTVGAGAALHMGTGSTVTCAGDIRVENGALLMRAHPAINCGGDLILTNNAFLTVVSGPTNGTGAAHGGYVRVSQELQVGAGSWIRPMGDPTNGGSVAFEVRDLWIGSGSGFNANGCGYETQKGPGITNGTTFHGAGHGGRGGRGTAFLPTHGNAYGSLTEPLTCGSGGGGGWVNPIYTGGGDGGGAIRLDAEGTVTLDGLVAANAFDAFTSQAGGGSGGSVFISCATFAGTGGVIQANGGKGMLSSDVGGGGGGGRIAVTYATNTSVGIRFEASPNATNTGVVVSTDWIGPQMGTLYLSNTNPIADVWKQQVRGAFVHVPGFSAWTGTVAVEEAMVGLPDGFAIEADDVWIGPNAVLHLGDQASLACAGDVEVDGGGLLMQRHPLLLCGGDLRLTNGATVKLFAGPTNGVSVLLGGAVRVTNDCVIAPGSWIYPHGDPTNGGTIAFDMRNLSIGTNAGFNADARGYQNEFGPGKPTANTGFGAGHGGAGGGTGGGGIYGHTNGPTQAGSGGANVWGGSGYRYVGGGLGGGAIRIAASGHFRHEGILSANGGNRTYSSGGGGSGGSVFVRCRELTGPTNGVIRANGGNGSAGGGGGGRIALWAGVSDERVTGILDGSNMSRVVFPAAFSDYKGTAVASYGTGTANGETGTVVFLDIPYFDGSVILIR